MSLEKITLFMMRETVTGFADFIKTEDGKKNALPALRSLEVPNLDDFDGEAEVSAAYRKLPGKKKETHDVPWLGFLNEGLQPAQKFEFKWQNAFPSAVAAIRIEKDGAETFYAITFGLGAETFISMDQVVRDFGIKVAMNIADPEKLKRIRTSIHEAISTQAERQISIGSRLSVFNVDDEKEFLRTLSGKALPQYSFVSSFTGKESISLQIDKDEPLAWDNLIDRIDQIGTAYNSDAYQQIFKSYDKFEVVKDAIKTEILDGLAFEKIRSDDFTQVHLAPPEFIEYDHTAFIYANDDSKAEHSDLSLTDLLSYRKRSFGQRSSMASIRNMRIILLNTETEIHVRRWSAYKCLVAEVQHEGQTFILSMGSWKKVSDDLKDEVENYLAAIDVLDVAYLPDGINIWNAEAKKDKDGNYKGENQEAVFNERVSAECVDLMLFDRSKIEIAGERRYEICDLLHLDRTMVHVKRFRSGSASVSHLFLQGRFYADGFVGDDRCRLTMCDFVRAELEVPEATDFASIIPAQRSELVSNEYSVVFCILVETTDFSLADLPFMARYELMHSHRHIHGVLGFGCMVAFSVVELGP